MIAPTTLPELTAVMEATGEIAPVGLSANDLTAYAEARHRLAAAELARQRRLDELAARDQALAELQREIDGLAAAVHETDAALAGLWTQDLRRQAGTIRLAAPGITVVWPKPAVVWEQGVKPEQIATRNPDLAAELRIRQVVRAAPGPRITLVGGEA